MATKYYTAGNVREYWPHMGMVNDVRKSLVLNGQLWCSGSNYSFVFLFFHPIFDWAWWFELCSKLKNMQLRHITTGLLHFILESCEYLHSFVGEAHTLTNHKGIVPTPFCTTIQLRRAKKTSSFACCVQMTRRDGSGWWRASRAWLDAGKSGWGIIHEVNSKIYERYHVMGDDGW